MFLSECWYLTHKNYRWRAMSVAFAVPLRGKAATGTDCLSAAHAGQSSLGWTGTTVSTLSVTLLSGLVASFFDMTLFLLFLYIRLFNIHYMHVMQVGKKWLWIHVLMTRQTGTIAKHALSQLGCFFKFFILNGFHKNNCRNRNVYIYQSTLFSCFLVVLYSLFSFHLFY